MCTQKTKWREIELVKYLSFLGKNNEHTKKKGGICFKEELLFVVVVASFLLLQLQLLSSLSLSLCPLLLLLLLLLIKQK